MLRLALDGCAVFPSFHLLLTFASQADLRESFKQEVPLGKHWRDWIHVLEQTFFDDALFLCSLLGILDVVEKAGLYPSFMTIKFIASRVMSLTQNADFMTEDWDVVDRLGVRLLGLCSSYLGHDRLESVAGIWPRRRD